MWNVLSKKQVFSFAALLFGFVYLLLLYIFHGDNHSLTINESNVIKTVRVLSYASLITMGTLYVMAKWGWKLAWRNPLASKFLNKKICPDLNGTWRATLVNSNTDEVGNPIEMKATVEILADFIDFEMTLKSDCGTQTSTVVLSKIGKDETNHFYLTYVFVARLAKNLNDRKGEDIGKFEGAAKLDILVDKDEVAMDGVYWSNRQWEKNKQTAGHIELTRVKRTRG